MNYQKRYNILVVDNDIDRRMRLKAASVSAGMFEDVQLCKDYRTGLEKLRIDTERVIVFIGKVDGAMTAGDFIREARETSDARDSAFIQILDTTTGGKVSAVASTVLAGVDGILQEPFSVDALLEVTKLAAVVYGARRQAREEGAALQLIKSMLKLLDTIATSKKIGDGAGGAFRELREAGSAVKNLNPALLPFYVTNLIEETEKAEVPMELVLFLKKQADELAGRAERQNRAAALQAETEKRVSDSSRRIIRKK